MSWGDFDAVASWRGVDGILTQLKTLGTYGVTAVTPTLSLENLYAHLRQSNCRPRTRVHLRVR
jgi:hypothetical protein